MWKVLLVEDELFVRESVREIIDWEKSGFKMIGEAGNGKEALDFIEENTPDLVITDILMPVMDGIELLEQAKKSGFDCCFVMLSCMSDFEYVRQAMENGASNYILKLSMDQEVVEDVLTKIDKQLVTQAGKRVQEMHNYYVRVWEYIHKMSDSIEKDKIVPPFSIYKNLSLTVITILNGSTFSEKDFWNLDLVKNNNEDIVHFFTRLGQTTIFYWSKSSPGFNLGTSHTHSNHVIIYSQPVRYQDIITTWERVLRCLDKSWFSGKKGIYKCSDQHIATVNHGFPWEKEQEMIWDFQEMKDYECQHLLEDIWMTMEKYFISMVQVKGAARRFIQIFSRITNSQRPQFSLVDHSTSHQELKLIMFEKMKSYLQKRIELNKNKTDHDEVNKVIQYIEKNYNQQITVKAMAKYVAINENYLSHIFTEKTGKTLIQYLHGVRIGHAKNYLLNTNLSISVVSEKVGYMNDNYFIKIFKRMENQTPSVFRKTIK